MMIFLSLLSLMSIASVSALRLRSLKSSGTRNVISRFTTTASTETLLKSSKSDDGPKDRPFTLPAGAFKPKQSLGQNFLSDQNYVLKICDAFTDKSLDGHRVVEIGPGPGALTRVLFQRYPSMTAIEIDQRAVAFLGEKLPGLQVQHLDVLEADWASMAAARGGSLNIIANLPYYIVSQVLFSLADNHKAIDTAVVTMQLEVAERIVAKPSTKQYGIPSVVFQLYAAPKINFKIPPSVFYPKPNVDSALLTLDFTKPHPELHRINGDHLRRILTAAFQQRRKMMRQSLKDLLNQEKLVLADHWGKKRPEELSPTEFIQLTAELFGEELQPIRETVNSAAAAAMVAAENAATAAAIIASVNSDVGVKGVKKGGKADKGEKGEKVAVKAKDNAADRVANRIEGVDRSAYVSRPVWRKALFGASGSPTQGKTPEVEVEEQ